jgi:ankyrin repeat protein
MVLADPGLLLTPPPSSGLLTTGAGLQSAAEFGHTEAVLSLVQECGANVNTADLMGVTPVYAGVNNGHTETVWVMVRECGADPCIADNDGWCPLEDAATEGDTGMLWTMLCERAAAQHFVPRGEGREAPASMLHTLKAVAGRAGHAKTVAMLEWLEELENTETVYKDANDVARRGGFEFPVCLETTDKPLSLALCRRRVCRGYWKKTNRSSGDCPMCRVSMFHAEQQA